MMEFLIIVAGAVLVGSILAVADLGGVVRDYSCKVCITSFYSPNQTSAPICKRCGNRMTEYNGE